MQLGGGAGEVSSVGGWGGGGVRGGGQEVGMGPSVGCWGKLGLLFLRSSM